MTDRGASRPNGARAIPQSGSGTDVGDFWSSAAIASLILDHLTDAVFATDPDNRVTFWGPSAERLFGYTAAQALGRPFGELLPYRMAAEEDEAAFFATLRAGRTWRGSGSVRLAGGTELWIESTVQPLLVDGRFVGSVSVSRDMSVQRETQHLLLEQGRFVDAVLEVMGTLVSVLDAEGRTVRFNRAAAELSGRTLAELAERPFWEVILPEREVADVRATFEQLRAGDFPNSHENHWVTATGEERLISWSNTCLTDEAGRVTHVIGTGIDVTEARRTTDALAGIEAVGRLLASAGPTEAMLEAVVDRLVEQMGYRLVTLIMAEGTRWRLGAQRGYAWLPAYFDPERGIIGRVLRTGAPAFVTDVRTDPDYVADDAGVRAEICVPLRADGTVLGVLDLEATAEVPLAESDLHLAQAVADRLAVALLLGHEQVALRERVGLLAAVTEFARTVGAVRDPGQLWPALVSAAARVIEADIVSLTTLDRDTGRYVVRAVTGADDAIVGGEIRPGEGAAGRAILERTLVVSDALPRARYAEVARPLVPADVLATVGVPLLREGVVLGALVFARSPERPFGSGEQEIAALLGAQAALAVANAHLLAEVSELAIHDPLTGLYNRRHFDATLELLVARWRREQGRVPLAAIMYDLDRFGDFNRSYGHQAGDQVLRTFAGVLRERARSSDLLARYGGEEFVAVLEGCDLAGAQAVAEAIRETFMRRELAGPDGGPLHATVSAGCAVLDPGQPTAEALIRAADVGMFMAKRAGRNQVVAV